jgi:hypothetical protein
MRRIIVFDHLSADGYSATEDGTQAVADGEPKVSFRNRVTAIQRRKLTPSRRGTGEARRVSRVPLLPLASLVFTGLYLFVLPYATNWRSGRRTEVRGTLLE